MSAAKMTPAQRQVQRNLDAYLADGRNPGPLDVRSNVERLGAAAFDPLAPIVAPLRAERVELTRAG